MSNKAIIRFGFCNILNNQDLGKCYQPVEPLLVRISQKPHPIVVNIRARHFEEKSHAREMLTEKNSLASKIPSH